MCTASSARRFRAGLNPPVGVRTSRMLVYFELEDPFCSGLYPLVQESLTGALAAMSVLSPS